MNVTRIDVRNGDSFADWADAIEDLEFDYQDRLELTDGERTVIVRPAGISELEILLAGEDADGG